MLSNKHTVAHCVYPYLALTENWIYRQLQLPPPYRTVVVTNRTTNLQRFPHPAVHALDDQPMGARLANRLWGKIMSRRPLPFERTTILREGVAVLHAHFGQVGYAKLPLKRACHLPLVTSFYGYDFTLEPRRNPAWVSRYRELFAVGERFLVEGPAAKRSLEQLGCPSEKLIINHLGVDLIAIPFAERRPPSDGIIRVLLAGTFVEKKGLPDALEALTRLNGRHRMEILLVGDASPLDPRGRGEKEKIQRVIAKTPLRQCVRSFGYVENHKLHELALQSHCFVAASKTGNDGDAEGGAPVTIIEMLATGLPVVATRHCDIPEMVRDGESGVLVPEGSIEALARAIDWVISAPERWPAMGHAGRRYVEQHFNAARQVQKLANIYGQLTHD